MVATINSLCRTPSKFNTQTVQFCRELPISAESLDYKQANAGVAPVDYLFAVMGFDRETKAARASIFESSLPRAHWEYAVLDNSRVITLKLQT